VETEAKILSVTWSDRSASHYHALMLRENIPDAETIHPLAREKAIAPTMIPQNLEIRSASIDEASAITIIWSDTRTSRYHPGWLHAQGWFGPEEVSQRRVLHGRAGYDAKVGMRFIKGIYSDRDDLLSCIRILKRQQRQRGE
jgi:hypothetical protein